MSQLDIVIPVKDEAENVEELTTRIHRSLSKAKIRYCMIFVDDHSTDNTLKRIKVLAKNYPIKVYKKQGKPGKAYSILEGSRRGRAKYVAMIDGDLQYAPEVLPEMYKLAQKHGVVVANRKGNSTSRLRKIASKVYNFFFGKLLYGFDCDVQSGLKVFKKEVIEHIREHEVSPWTIDINLLHTVQELGYTIGCVDIQFEGRKNGHSKISFVKDITLCTIY